jgi:hypothetical protein
MPKSDFSSEKGHLFVQFQIYLPVQSWSKEEEEQIHELFK